MPHLRNSIRSWIAPALLGIQMLALLACEPVAPILLQPSAADSLRASHRHWQQSDSTVDSVSVSLGASTLAVGATTQATATLLDSSDAVITGPAISWSSSDPAVATVSGTGVVSAVGAGTATVVATSEGQSGTAALTVTAPVVIPPPPTTASGRWVTGYWVGYQRDLYPETAVDFSLMTHLIVGSLGVTKTGGVTRDFFLDPTTGPAVAKTLSARAHQAGRKALLMIGGAGQHDNLAGAAAPATVNTFVANLVQAMTDLGYDGLDVDWEPITDADKPNVLVFLQKLRAAKPGIILTVPIGWSSVFDGTGAWFATLAPLADQLNIMSYEMADAWPGWASWHEAALYGQGSDHPSSVSLVVSRYVSYGVPAAKLGVGLGFYGSCWKGPTAPLQPVGSGVVASDNTMSYVNIMTRYYTAGAYRWDATAKQGYLSFAAPTGPAGCTLVSYEDEQSIAEKGAYVKSAGLGGAMIWTVNQGHLPAAPAGSQDPLLRATFQAVGP